jgi:hypothetical protein
MEKGTRQQDLFSASGRSQDPQEVSSHSPSPMKTPPTSDQPPRKKKHKTSMKSRSRHHLEALGYVVTDVEQKVKYLGMTILRDAYGFGDLLFCGNGQIGLCQSTSTHNLNQRVEKILSINEADTWLRSGGKIIVHGWQKEREQGTRRKVWTVTTQEIHL